MAEVKSKEVAKKEEVKATKDAAVEKKVAEKKTPAKKTTTKTTTKKTTTKKATEKVVVQFDGREFDLDTIKANVKQTLKAEKVKATDVRIYIKPEDNKAYFVAGEYEGCIDLQ